MAPKTKRAMSQAEKDSVLPRKRARTQERREARSAAQELRRQANVVRRHMGTPTPWEQACEARRLRRSQAGWAQAA